MELLGVPVNKRKPPANPPPGSKKRSKRTSSATFVGTGQSDVGALQSSAASGAAAVPCPSAG
jgi:hypothetical protein